MTVSARGWEVGLCSLYLRGIGGSEGQAPRFRWRLVAQCLREASCASAEEAARALRQAGFEEEASRVSDASRWACAAKLVERRQAASGLSAGVPIRWLERLDVAAPPAFWCSRQTVLDPPTTRGQTPSSAAQRFLAVVGSRHPQPQDAHGVEVAVAGARALGFGVISGGAKGVDTWARHFARVRGVPLLEVLPSGLAVGSVGPPGSGVRLDASRPGPHQSDRAVQADPAVCAAGPGKEDKKDILGLAQSTSQVGELSGSAESCSSPGAWSAQISLHPPGSAFTTAAAMERNTLIYAAAEAALVVRPRFRAGGTWHGALEALRRRLCPVLVLDDPDSMATRALCALGAVRFDPALCLEANLARCTPQQGAFCGLRSGFWPEDAPAGAGPGTIVA